MNASVLSWALGYASAGFAVLPVSRRGKRPLTEHGVLDATTDTGRVRHFWRKYPDANIGIAVGPGALVLDWDPRNAGGRSFDQFAAEIGLSRLGPSQQTGGGGLHVWYRLPDGLERSDIKSTTPGLDLKSKGGFVVVAPSVHASGNRYEWLSDLEDLRRGPAHLPELPPELVQLLRKVVRRKPAQPPLSGIDGRQPRSTRGPGWVPRSDPATDLERARRYVAAFPISIEGDHGDDRAFRLAAKLVHDFALSTSDALTVLLPWAARCLPPWSREEIEKKLDNAQRHGGRQPKAP